MTKLTDEQIEAIRTAAKACPPGPYRGDGYRLHAPLEEGEEFEEVLFSWKQSGAIGANEVGKFAELICQPDVVLAMIAEIEASRKREGAPDAK